MYNTDINKFDEYGYVVITDFLTESQHKELNIECATLTQYAESLEINQDDWILNSPHNPCKLDGAMAKSNVFRDLGRHPILTGAARTILGYDNIDTYISKFFPMVPKKGFSVDWHQDNFYIQADRSKLISCDVFVNGADPQNGCLRIVPKSHLNGVLPHDNSSHGVFNWLTVDDSDVLDISINEPFAILFHVDLVHGCYINTSDRYRYSVAWEYMDSKYTPKTHRGHVSQDRIAI